jgi:hypothetical protein
MEWRYPGSIFLLRVIKSSGAFVYWSGRHVDSCGKVAAMLRFRSAQREEAQRRPAESEVPGTEMNRPHMNAIPFDEPNHFPLFILLSEVSEE